MEAGVYLGLADEDEDRRFEWLTGEPFVFANWETGEPSGSGPYGYKRMSGYDESGPWYHGMADDPLVDFFLCEVPLFPNEAAVVDAGRDVRVECDGEEGTHIPVFGSGSYDIDDEVLLYRWAADTCSFTDEDAADTEAICPVGENLVRLTAIDPAGAGSSDEVILTTYDNDPPTGGISAPAEGECRHGPVSIQDDSVDRWEVRRRADAPVLAATWPALRWRRRPRGHADRRR